MYDGNPGEIDFGSSKHEVRVSEGSSYPESTVKGFQLTLHKLSVASLLDGPWADLWPFFAWLYFKRFSLYIVDPSGSFAGGPQPW